MKIRRARRADFAALVAIEEEAFRTDRLTRRKLMHLTTRGNASLLVGEERGEVVGYALVLFRRGSRGARLYGIAVAASRRGRGLGERLLVAAEKEARGRGATRLSLETNPANRIAVRLYEKMGYERTARLGSYYEDGSPAERHVKSLVPARKRRRSEFLLGAAPRGTVQIRPPWTKGRRGPRRGRECSSGGNV